MVYGGGSEDEVDNVGGDGGELPKPGMYHPFSLFLCTSQTGQIHKCHSQSGGKKLRGEEGGDKGGSAMPGVLVYLIRRRNAVAFLFPSLKN